MKNMSVVIQNCILQQERELGSPPCDDQDEVQDSPYYLWPSSNGSTMKFHDLKNRLSTWSNNFLLASICTVVAIGFFVPVIIYIAEPAESRAAINFNFGNCTSLDDNSSALYLYSDNCSSYNGLCMEHLGRSNDNLSSTLALKEISENELANFIDILNQFSGTGFVSEQCAEVVLPFLCQYIHPPCDGNGSVNLISQEQCSNIRDVVCADEWRLAMGTSSSSLLPVCEHFSGVDNITGDNTTQTIPQPIQCNYQFKEYCGLCRPLCGEFSLHSVQSKFVERIAIITTAVLAFIGGILVFIAAIIRRKVMMNFPQILVVYWTLCIFIIACLVLITYLGGQERLYCTDEFLDVALENPSVFCQITGFCFHWLLVLIGIFWLQHLCHLFLKIMFPIWSKKHNDMEQSVVLHVMEVSGAVFISILAPVIYLAVSKYTVIRFPPVLCFPSRKVIFYTVCLPLCVILGSGSILFIIIFWTLVKRKQLIKKRSSNHFCSIKFGIPEVKILLLSTYFVIVGIVTLVTVSIIIRDSEVTADSLLNYILCQVQGYTSTNSCAAERHELESHLQPGLSSMTCLLLGLLPWSNLLFAVQFTDISQALKKIKSVYQSMK
ncbi:uncharacterized protein [Dysidea avara]|uniref:uncharacterized protein isoform X1 n=1 Tax=Dysidea avara TaxID=196820 RepID=UPI00331D7B66